MDLQNWKTTIGGLMAAVGAALALAPLPDDWKWVPQFMTALGGALVGLAAKDSTTHSTAEQIAKSTAIDKIEKADK